MPAPPAVWLADAVRAVRRLGADPETAQRIVTLLGLRSPEVYETPPDVPVPPTPAVPGTAAPPGRRTEAPQATTPREVTAISPAHERQTAGRRPIVERDADTRERRGRDRPPRHLPSLADVLGDPRLRAGEPVTREETVDIVKASTVAIVAADADEPAERAGTGFFVARGWVLTCAHVMRSTGDLRITWRGHTLPVVSIRWAPTIDAATRYPDAALVQVTIPPGEVTPQPPVTTGLPAPGGQVWIVSHLATTEHDVVTAEPGRFIQVRGGDAEPGTSGAPVVDLATNQICGMLTAVSGRMTLLTSIGDALTGENVPVAVHAATMPGSLRLEPTTLLPPGRQRAILAALSSGPAATDTIDTDELVDRIARREPIQALPITVAVTTRRGIQVLVDFGDGMRPFVRDQEEAVEGLRRIAGPDGFELLRFAVTPLDDPGAGPGPVWTWRPYQQPPAGRPVVVLSDLGAGASPATRSAAQRRWIRFARQLRAGGYQVVALAPLPARRYPSALRAVLPILTWDRSTSVADAARAARAAAGTMPGSRR